MSKMPESYERMKEQYPEVLGHYEALGEAATKAGPLDAKTVALIKLAYSVAAGLEGAAHSSTRKGVAAGCTPEELRHAAVLGITTLGFPSMMRAKAWLEDVLDM